MEIKYSHETPVLVYWHLLFYNMIYIAFIKYLLMAIKLGIQNSAKLKKLHRCNQKRCDFMYLYFFHV